MSAICAFLPSVASSTRGIDPERGGIRYEAEFSPALEAASKGPDSPLRFRTIRERLEYFASALVDPIPFFSLGACADLGVKSGSPVPTFFEGRLVGASIAL